MTQIGVVLNKRGGDFIVTITINEVVGAENFFSRSGVNKG
jgi:hypothetical protein